MSWITQCEGFVEKNNHIISPTTLAVFFVAVMGFVSPTMLLAQQIDTAASSTRIRFEHNPKPLVRPGEQNKFATSTETNGRPPMRNASSTDMVGAPSSTLPKPVIDNRPLNVRIKEAITNQEKILTALHALNKEIQKGSASSIVANTAKLNDLLKKTQESCSAFAPVMNQKPPMRPAEVKQPVNTLPVVTSTPTMGTSSNL